MSFVAAGKAGAQGAAVAAIRLVPDDSEVRGYSSRERLEDLNTSLGAAVVDDDHLVSGVRRRAACTARMTRLATVPPSL